MNEYSKFIFIDITKEKKRIKKKGETEEIFAVHEILFIKIFSFSFVVRFFKKPREKKMEILFK